MAHKDISNRFRIGFKNMKDCEPMLSIRKWYIINDKPRPGHPGMELTLKQFQFLSQLKESLEDCAIRGTNAQCWLGGNKQVTVQGGNITLWRLPYVLGPVMALSHSLKLPTELWREIWEHEQWALSELSALNSGKEHKDQQSKQQYQQPQLHQPTAQQQLPDQPQQLDHPQSTHQQPPHLEMLQQQQKQQPSPRPDWRNAWWLGFYPTDPEELPAWAASLTPAQLIACPDRHPGPWDEFWDAWQAAQVELQKRLAPSKKPADKSTHAM